jgi:hypothetical protein
MLLAWKVLLAFVGIGILDVVFLALADLWLVRHGQASVSQVLRDLTFVYPRGTIGAIVVWVVLQLLLVVHLWG